VPYRRKKLTFAISSLDEFLLSDARGQTDKPTDKETNKQTDSQTDIQAR